VAKEDSLIRTRSDRSADPPCRGLQIDANMAWLAAELIFKVLEFGACPSPYDRALPSPRAILEGAGASYGTSSLIAPLFNHPAH
jgi:hypothetical protein